MLVEAAGVPKAEVAAGVPPNVLADWPKGVVAPNVPEKYFKMGI
jgi:hypothetical protein